MNIIKFIDKYVPTDTGLVDAEWYNENLKGKYAYWVRCHYVIPLDSITPQAYISFETTINNLLGNDYYALKLEDDVYTYKLIREEYINQYIVDNAVLVEVVPENPGQYSPELIKLCHNTIKYVDLWRGDYDWMNCYVDQVGTNEANSIDKFKQYNSYIPEGRPTTDEIKTFRTWLATSLLDMNYTFYEWNVDDEEWVELSNPYLTQYQAATEVIELPETGTEDQVVKIKDKSIVDWDPDTVHILSYYKDGMYDDTLKWITEFGGLNIKTNIPALQNACGCGSGTNISSLYTDSVSMCNLPNIYRESLKAGMVRLFSNTSTWVGLKTYNNLVQAYIDNIIQSNMSLGTVDSSKYYGCECVGMNAREGAVGILRQLSTAFGYLAEGESETNKHLNFIVSTLTSWASELYELMEWA